MKKKIYVDAIGKISKGFRAGESKNLGGTLPDIFRKVRGERKPTLTTKKAFKGERPGYLGGDVSTKQFKGENYQKDIGFNFKDREFKRASRKKFRGHEKYMSLDPDRTGLMDDG